MRGYRLLLAFFLILTLVAGCGESPEEIQKNQAAQELKADLSAQKALMDKRAALRYEKEAWELMQRVMTIFDGYQSVYGKYPTKLSDLGKEDYLFDEQYTKSIIPETYQVYLLMNEAADQFKVWLIRDGEDLVFSRTAADKQMSSQSWEAMGQAFGRQLLNKTNSRLVLIQKNSQSS